MNPHQMASYGSEPDVDAHQADDGLGTVVVEKVRQMFCGIHGHDTFLQFEHDRMFLRCVSCGHESPGWELTETPPTVTNRATCAGTCWCVRNSQRCVEPRSGILQRVRFQFRIAHRFRFCLEHKRAGSVARHVAAFARGADDPGADPPSPASARLRASESPRRYGEAGSPGSRLPTTDSWYPPAQRCNE